MYMLVPVWFYTSTLVTLTFDVLLRDPLSPVPYSCCWGLKKKKKQNHTAQDHTGQTHQRGKDQSVRGVAGMGAGLQPLTKAVV